MIFLKTLALSLALFFVACDDNPSDTDTQSNPPDDDGTYVGTFVVAPETADEFTLNNARVEFNINLAEIKMLDVKFAAKMPAMNITIPGITLDQTTDGYSISGDGLIPTTMMGGNEVPVDRYTITGLTGTANETSLSFEMMCGAFHVSYTTVNRLSL